jgi:uncharacterized repeat protein (TIGR03803 family)
MNYVRDQDRTWRIFAAFVAVMVVLTLAGPAIPAQAQTYSVVGVFSDSDHRISGPQAEQVVQGRNGDIYTMSEPNGGIINATTSGTLRAVAQPFGNGVTLGSDGNFYTALSFDNIGCGEVDRTTPQGTITFLASICGTFGNGPQTEPIQAPNGLFYGTASEIPSGQQGTIYSMNSSGALTLMHTFAGTDGINPIAPLVVGSDGNLYGGTRFGGTNNDGVLFKITTGGTFTVLHNFTGTDGRDLEHAMILARDGNLYGVTQGGGTVNQGVMFKLTNSGTYTVLFNLPVPYSYPNSRLVQATDGNFYGLLGQGNSSQPGWIYSLTPSGTFTIVYQFCQQTNCTDGVAPSTPMVQHTDGKLYGFTIHGGDTNVCGGDGCGVFYSLDLGLGEFVTLGSTSGKEGTKVGILGQGFTSATTVSFGGTKATTVTRSGSTYLTATVPTGALTGSVTVTTGSTTLTSAQTFSVLPTFISFSPTSGPVGTVVTLSGTGLEQTGKVTFNGKSASFSVTSDSQVTATVPTGATTGKIKITTKGGSVTGSTNFTVN